MPPGTVTPDPSATWRRLQGLVDEHRGSLPCQQHPQEMWFPELGTPNEQMDQARWLCSRCPILDECRAYGIAAGRAEDGIWGGLTKPQRIKARARGQAQPTGKVVSSSWEPAT